MGIHKPEERRMLVPGKGKRMSKGIEWRVSMKGLRCHTIEIEFYHKSNEELHGYVFIVERSIWLQSDSKDGVR